MDRVHEASSFILNTLSKEAKELKANISEQLSKTRELGGEVRDVLGGEKGLGETQQLAEHVSQLADRLKTSIVGDPIGTAKKLSPCKLVGNSHQCRLYKRENLYNQDVNLVRMELKYLVGQRDMSLEDLGASAAGGFGTVPGGFIAGYLTRTFNISAIVGVLIENRSDYSLVFHDWHSSEGYFFTHDVDESFQGPGKSIEPGFTAGLVHSKDDLMPQSSAGYVSFTIDDEYRVLMAWDVHRAGANRVAIEIRQLDENGNVLGEAIDVKKLHTHKHDGHAGMNEIVKSWEPIFRVRYLFSNEKVTEHGFHLIVENY